MLQHEEGQCWWSSARDLGSWQEGRPGLCQLSAPKLQRAQDSLGEMPWQKVVAELEEQGHSRRSG